MTQPKAAPDPRIDAAYMRCSSIDQGLKYGIDRQREAIRLSGEHDGEPVQEWFIDLESGANENREAFLRLQKLVADGRVRSVRVLCADRFARDTEIALRVAKQFLKNGTALKFVEMPVDITTPMGMLTFTQCAAFGAWELELIKGRSIAGRERKMATKNVPDAWMLPYGFQLVDGFPAFREDELAAIRMLFDLRRRHKSVYTILAALVQAGYKPRRAEAWQISSLRSLLRNRCYIGEYHRCKRTWPILDRDGKLLQAVEPKVFEEVNRMLDAVRQENTGRPDTQHHHLLRKMVWCGHAECRKRYVAFFNHARGKEYRYYRCSDATKRYPAAKRACCALMVPADALEKAVWKEIWTLLRDPERLRKLAVAWQREEQRKIPAARDPRRELEALRKREAIVQEMREDGNYTREVANEKLADLRRRMGLLEMEVRSTRQLVEIAPLDVVAHACRKIATGPEPEGVHRRIVLEGLIDLRITVLSPQSALVSAKLPIPAAEPQSGKKNRANYLASSHNSHDPIPFTFNVEIAA